VKTKIRKPSRVLPHLTEQDWAFLALLLNENGPALVQVHNKHIVAVQRFAPVDGATLEQYAQYLQGGLSEEDEEGKDADEPLDRQTDP
jgi:hypothetical protein